MRLSLGMKVGLVSLFSCLALWLGLLFPTGMALAHSASTLQSAHVSSIAVADPKRRTNLEKEGVDSPSISSTERCFAGTVTFVFGEAPRNPCDIRLIERER